MQSSKQNALTPVRAFILDKIKTSQMASLSYLRGSLMVTRTGIENPRSNLYLFEKS